MIEAESVVGGGALPAVGLPTAALAIDPGPRAPIAWRRRSGRADRRSSPAWSTTACVIDLRTVADDEEEALLAALAEAAGA